MKVAFSRPTANRHEQCELFENFWAVGYQGLQLKANQYMPYIDKPQQFCDEWGQHEGVAAGLILGDKLDDAGIASLRQLFTLAAAVGSERIIFCHLVPRSEVASDDIKHFARLLSELGREAQQQGVALSLHHHYNQPVMHRADIVTFFEAADPGSVGLTIDTAHLVKSGIADVAGVIRDFSDVIDNFHLKDFADGEWRVLGRGDLNFDPIFAAIGDIGYKSWLCADEESGGVLLGGMRECYDVVRHKLVMIGCS